MLSMDARRKGELIRPAIEKRAKVDLDFDPPPNADLATYLANDVVSALRHHVADLPTLLDLLVSRGPDVCFTVDREEAVSLLVAIIREQRLEEALEGLRLAGLLNEPAKDRHAGVGSEADLRGAAEGECPGALTDSPADGMSRADGDVRNSRRRLASSKPRRNSRRSSFVSPLVFIVDAEPLCTPGRSPRPRSARRLRVSEDETRSSELSCSVAARVCALADHGTVR
ncbi:hypothetical protein ACVWW4_004209 [Bradyrhizobium sp. LB7.1]